MTDFLILCCGVVLCCRVQTGTMRFGVIGVTEAQLLVMALLLSSGLVGPQFWQQPIPYLTKIGLTDSYPVYYALVVFGVMSVTFALYDSFRVVNAYNRANGIDSSAGHWQVGQFVGCLVFGCVWCYLTADTVFGSQPVLPRFSIGVCFAYLVVSDAVLCCAVLCCAVLCCAVLYAADWVLRLCFGFVSVRSVSIDHSQNGARSVCASARNSVSASADRSQFSASQIRRSVRAAATHIVTVQY